jgi:hypothetical protein
VGQIISSDTGEYLELDFWIPELNLAFEYQVLRNHLLQSKRKEYIKISQGYTSLLLVLDWEYSITQGSNC